MANEISDEDFREHAREKLRELIEFRRKLMRELDDTSNRISGLQLFLGESQTPFPTIERPTRARSFTPRGTKFKTILSLLREAGPHGLGLDDLVQRASALGVTLIKPSTRSQLSRARAEGLIESRDGRYVYTGPNAKTEDDQDLLSRTSSSDSGILE